MEQIIGSVRINEDDYPGRDLYSDGPVEDELLMIARGEDPSRFDQICAERKSWPVMYHFSSVRQNILSWYPFQKTDKVLEIGSGCGAVTPALVRAAGTVTCVDLSKKRSLVNAYRNRNAGNLEIRLGNFEDVEKKLPCDFDVITLIGVFEYGSSYIHSEHPYQDFLKIVLGHLRPGGHLLIAIENRLGLKYFAGCREDHSGRFFDGIENYPETPYVHTFSKPALVRLFQDAGVSDFTFYYPYPDYKFPMAIYSDGWMPKKGELRDNLSNYDQDRMILFDETKAWDALIEDGLFPIFSNSFLVDLTGEQK